MLGKERKLKYIYYGFNGWVYSLCFIKKNEQTWKELRQVQWMNEIRHWKPILCPTILSKNCLVPRCKKQEKFNKKYQFVNEQYTYNGGLFIICYEEKNERNMGSVIIGKIRLTSKVNCQASFSADKYASAHSVLPTSPNISPGSSPFLILSVKIKLSYTTPQIHIPICNQAKPL